jgi:hypothetical protein
VIFVLILIIVVCCVLYMNIDEILSHAIKNVFYIQRTKRVHLSEK